MGRRADSLLRQAEDPRFHGTALIASGGRIVLHKGYGWADGQRSRPVTTATPFWIASISKQFAAAAILELEEEGRLSIGDSITRFFPDVPSDKRDITLHQLMTHTAGLAQNYAADGITDRSEAVRAILARPLARPPGTGFGYSNDAYNLVAAVVEIAGRRPFETYLTARLLGPAGLVHTGFWGPREHPEVAAILAADPPDSTLARANWGFRGAVGMFSTAGDLYVWYRALEEGKALSGAASRKLLSPHVERGDLGVGYGWFFSTTTPGRPSTWTRGYEDFGHGAVLAAYPEDGVVVVVVSSSGERAERLPLSHALADELARIALAGLHPLR